MYERDSGLCPFLFLIDTKIRKAISDEVIPTNFHINLELALQVLLDLWPRVRHKTLIEIRGDVDLLAYLSATDDPFSLCRTDSSVRHIPCYT